jgi:hypothetical protein
MANYDFSGWATKNNLQCSDGRIIRKDAFKDNDGTTVPLVWNHDHDDPYRVVGHALLENRDEGVYAYCSLNDSDLGKTAKIYVQHGDIRHLSIYANRLKQQGPNVMHGAIREVSLVLAGANPGACIDNVMMHGEESDEEAVIFTDEVIDIAHSEENVKEDDVMSENENTEKTEKTIKEIYDEMTDEQKEAVHVIVGMAIDDDDDDVDDETDNNNENVEHSEGGNNMSEWNVFENNNAETGAVLSHADQESIVKLAKTPGVASLQQAIKVYGEQNGDALAHGIDDIETLFPEHHNINPGAPEILGPDQSWVMKVINKIHKSPYSRIRTRNADARAVELKAKGYQKKGDQKTLTKNLKLLGRKTEPQTIYVKDELHRDDVIDITDFSVIDYVWKNMKQEYYTTIALAALIGDGREDTDPDKIHQENVRSILNDDDLYTIHKDVDLAAAKEVLQGTNTEANFSENYIYAEAMIMAALYAREQYKGTGTPDYYCAPHSINVMLLARDLNGRRIYDSKADLAKALNVNEIIEIEQLEGVTRKTEEGDVKKLHGIFVNLSDYQFGATKGGELTKFEDFDIDFNKHKYLMEGRLSGALTKPFAAIVLEEPTPEEAAG